MTDSREQFLNAAKQMFGSRDYDALMRSYEGELLTLPRARLGTSAPGSATP